MLRPVWLTARATMVLAAVAVFGVAAPIAWPHLFPEKNSPGGSANTGGNNSGNNCAGSAVCNQTLSSPPQHVVRPVDASTGCPNPDATEPKKRQLSICVLYWCKGTVFADDGSPKRHEYQLKIRTLVTNYGDQSVDIAVDKPSRIRLLVAGGEIDKRWSPRSPTLSYGDRPIQVMLEGNVYWAIAPNRPRTEIATSSGYYTGFISTWTGPRSLAAHSTYGYTDPTPHQGNLIFQVPLEPSAGSELADVFGLAILDFNGTQPTVRAIDYADTWPAPQSPTSF